MSTAKRAAWTLLAIATVARIVSVYPDLLDFSRPVAAEYFNNQALPYLFRLDEKTEEKASELPSIRWRDRAFVAETKGGKRSWTYSPRRASPLLQEPQSLFWQNFFVFSSDEDRLYALSPNNGELAWVAYFPCSIDRVTSQRSQLRIECGNKSFGIDSNLRIISGG